MISTRSILLACTALTAAHIALPAVAATPSPAPIVIAQAPPPPPASPDDAKKKEAPPPAAKPAAPPPPPAAAPPAPQRAAPPPPPPAAAPPPPAAAKPPAPPAPPVTRASPPPPAPPPAATRAAPPPAPPAPPAAKPPEPPKPPAAQAPAAPAAQPPATPPQQRGERPAGPRGERPDGERQRGERPDGQRPGRPDGQRPGAPAAATPPAPPPAAAAPAAPPAQPAPPPAARGPAPGPQPLSPESAARALQGSLPASAPPPPPTRARSANEFIRRGDQGPQRGFDEIRRDRRETRDGKRTIISEGDRTIIRDGDRTIIRHNEADRFAVDARDVRVTRRGNETISIIVRPDGSQIVTTTGPDGRLIRRARRDRGGREVVIIDNRFAGARPGFFVNVPPPRYRGPPERYILDGPRINREAVYSIFLAPPIQRVDRRYTLEEVRYSEPLRAYMPRVDLDVNFATGSWQLSTDQFDQLAVIADGIKQAIAKNPREVFLIEGHTDAVGADEDNLSLSDRRAQSVAVALTEEFQVPPENLVTQGYGEQDLKVATDGPSEENRRVAVRRITPLIDQHAAR